MLKRLSSILLLLSLFAAPAYATDVCSADWSETDASNNVAAPRGWPEGMAPSGVNDAGRAMMGATKRWWNRNNAVKTSSGTNTVTLSYDVAAAAYCTGERYLFKVGGTNTGTTTLNINSLGAKTIKDLYGNDLVGGELTTNGYAEVIYDGTNMVLLSSARYLGSTFVWKKALSGANVDFDPLPTGFARCDLNIYDLIPASDGAGIDLTVKVSSFQTSSYIGVYTDADSSPANTAAAQTTAAIRLSGNVGNTSNRHLDAIATIFNPDGTALPKKVVYQSSQTGNLGVHTDRRGWGAYNGGTGAVTGLRIIPSTGNITSGTGVLVCWRF